VQRLLDFCKNPISQEVTLFSLHLLIKFMDAESEQESLKFIRSGPDDTLKSFPVPMKKETVVV